jgi:hypothetical protein
MINSFEEYLEAVKQRRDEYKYNYTDADLEKYKYYFEDCYTSNLSVYKALEWLYFEINYRTSK